jgi:2-dehydro-3-deoxyphosphooctonate aldolase (KDO 8-P synthase)
MSLKFILGPCVIESEAITMQIAETLKHIQEAQQLDIVFKASFDKANRTSLSSYRGPGIDEGLAILQKVKDTFGFPLITDVHEAAEIDACKEVVDILQIPAFLCRQTNLLVKAGQSGLGVNIKKGQFLSPEDMQHAVNKVRAHSSNEVLVTERGTTFGYRDLVVDFRSLKIMKETCQCPVVMDVTHSVQQPGAQGGKTGGRREFVPVLAKAAVAAGADWLFFETHPNPDQALSDGPNAWPLDRMAGLIKQLRHIHAACQLDEIEA